MPPLEHDPPPPSFREGALARFWPRGTGVADGAIVAGWRDGLMKFCPRSRRPSRARRRREHSGPRSIGHRPLSASERSELRADETYLRRAGISAAHPAPRSACDETPGPCPFVGCRQHLYLGVNPRNGSITLNFPGKQPWELDETCAIRVAKTGPQSLEAIGRLFNITMERVSQILDAAEPKLKAAARAENLGDGDESESVAP